MFYAIVSRKSFFHLAFVSMIIFEYLNHFKPETVEGVERCRSVETGVVRSQTSAASTGQKYNCQSEGGSRFEPLFLRGVDWFILAMTAYQTKIMEHPVIGLRIIVNLCGF